MKTRLLLAILSLLFLPMTARAQTKVSLASEIVSFWKNFQGAVTQNNPATVAALTRFPFLYPNEINRAAFVKIYPKIFDTKTRLCIAKAQPVPDEGFFNVFCGGNAFMFGQYQGAYKFFSVESRD